MLASATASDNAPVSKFVVVTVSSCSLLASLLKIKQLFHLQVYPHLLNDHQVHRLLTSHFVFSTSSEILFGGLLFYHLRVLERLYGSKKYAAFLTVTTTLTTLLEIGVLVAFHSLGWRMVPSGPYGVIFASLYMYQNEVPVTDRFRLLGIAFSQKSFVYLMAIQLLASQYPNSLVSAACGFLAGAMYAADVGRIRRWRYPAALQRFAGRYLLPALQSAPPPRSGAPDRLAAGPSSSAGARSPVDAAPPTGLGSAPVEIETVSPESIDLLVSMGFPRDRSEQVLRRVGGDVERAVQALI
ncbi:hypothetical protein RI367_005032 [Sorochytrium milnesiophthora]